MITPVSVTALLAAAIFESRSAGGDTAALRRVVALLVQAVGASHIVMEIRDRTLRLNDSPIPVDAPGEVLLCQALTNHHTSRLAVPASLDAAQWQALIELYASTPGLYASLDDVRDALRSTVPDVMVTGVQASPDTVDLREALFELPGLRAASNAILPTAPARDPHDAERAAFRSRVAGVLGRAHEAREQGDDAKFATWLLELADLERHADEDSRAVLVTERRRVISADALEELAHRMTKSANPALLARALAATGRDGADALIIGLHGAATPAQRRLYVDTLADCRDCDDAVVGALSSPVAHLNRDAAEIAGRKRIGAAVPMLAQLLKHRETDVRTAAWHALELIGTREAVRTLRS